MKQPWRMQLASDIVRDGLGLELLVEQNRVAAEVFRCDTNHTVTVVAEGLVQKHLASTNSRFTPTNSSTLLLFPPVVTFHL